MAQQNLTLRRGDTGVYLATVTLDGAPLDISTYDIWMTAKYSKDDPDADALFQVTKAAGAITVGGADNNVATITVAATLTSPLTTDVSVFYDVQIKAPGGSGQVSTVADGTLAIARDVTRATSA